MSPNRDELEVGKEEMSDVERDWAKDYIVKIGKGKWKYVKIYFVVPRKAISACPSSMSSAWR